MMRAFLITLTLIVCVCLFGCSASDPAASFPLPAFSDDALHSSGSYQGDVHLRDVQYSENGGAYTFKLNFLSADGLPLSELPIYRISISENPSRLYVRASVTSFDSKELVSNAGCAYYMIDEGGYSVFCAQFADPIVFSVSENGSELGIEISPLASNADTKYFVIGTDERLEEFGFTWAFADNQMVYIGSTAYDDEDMAQSAIAELTEKNDFPENTVRIAKISEGRLTADYLTNFQLIKAQNAPRLFDENQTAVEAHLWAYGAKPVCEFADKTYLFSKTVTGGEEKLFTYLIGGEGKELINAPVGRCIAADIRSDGELAALINEQNGEYRVFIYDIAREQSYDLTDFGMGVLTSDIAWGDDNCLYAISGTDSYQTIMKFDPFAHSLGQTCVFTIGDEDIMNGQLFAGAGRLYYLSDGFIRTCLRNGQCKLELIPAGSFLVSPNGKYIAAQCFDEEANASFILYDVENAQETVLFNGEALSYVFSKDSDILHFTVYSEDTPDTPAQLRSYNIMEERSYKQAYMNTDIVFPMPAGNAAITLYLSDGTPVTYTIKCIYN